MVRDALFEMYQTQDVDYTRALRRRSDVSSWSVVFVSRDRLYRLAMTSLLFKGNGRKKAKKSGTQQVLNDSPCIVSIQSLTVAHGFASV